MLTPDQLSSLRAALEEERDTVRRQLEELPTEDDFDENFADSGQVAAEQGEHRTLLAALTDQLHDVEHALARLDEGTYGTCEEGGEEIPFDRLDAMPATRFCIQHA